MSGAGAFAGRWPCDTATSQPRWPTRAKAKPGGTHSASHPRPPELGETPQGRTPLLGLCHPQRDPQDRPQCGTRTIPLGFGVLPAPSFPPLFSPGTGQPGTADPPSALHGRGRGQGTPHG